jgi:DNA-binding PadR family transcriptional regulator
MSPVTLHVLLSLADGDRHGYAIKQEISERTDGAVTLAVGTLYEALYRLERSGAIRSMPTAETTSGGAPRRTYHLTINGRRLLRAELARLEAILQQASRKKVRVLPT